MSYEVSQTLNCMHDPMLILIEEDDDEKWKGCYRLWNTKLKRMMYYNFSNKTGGISLTGKQITSTLVAGYYKQVGNTQDGLVVVSIIEDEQSNKS